MSYHIRYEELDKHWVVTRTRDAQSEIASKVLLHLPIVMRFTSEEQARKYIEKSDFPLDGKMFRKKG